MVPLVTRKGIRSALRVLKMAIFRRMGRSDYARWTDPDSLEVWWESRTRQLSALIPAGTRVIEFGAGRRPLESLLDETCTYIASDLVERGSDTFICDLNLRPLPDLAPLKPDVSVFAGVLEYVRDVPAVVDWLSTQVAYCVASYAVSNRSSSLVSRIKDSYWRSYYGYMNSYAEGELIAIFLKSGFTCLRTETWRDQRIFLFESSRKDMRP
jgi:hypothetical protein